jgi:hypothetical protein
MIHRAPLVWLMTLGLLLAAGCGGDDDSEGMTKEEWVAAADAICVDMDAELAPIPEPQTPEEIADAGEQAAQITRNGISELRALNPPEGDDVVVSELLDSFDALVDVGAEFTQAAAAAGSLEEMSAEVETLFRELEAANENARQLAEDYGLKQCFANQEG